MSRDDAISLALAAGIWLAAIVFAFTATRHEPPVQRAEAPAEQSCVSLYWTRLPGCGE